MPDDFLERAYAFRKKYGSIRPWVAADGKVEPGGKSSLTLWIKPPWDLVNNRYKLMSYFQENQIRKKRVLYSQCIAMQVLDAVQSFGFRCSALLDFKKIKIGGKIPVSLRD